MFDGLVEVKEVLEIDHHESGIFIGKSAVE